jgi:DNA-binding response OmpR family regulator
MAIRVVVITDDFDVAETARVCVPMRWPGSLVTWVSSGSQGLSLVQSERPDAVLLDLALGQEDGLVILESIRRVSRVPVLVLAVSKEEVKVIRALEMGADAHLFKPLSHLELMARVNALLRRSRPSS